MAISQIKRIFTNFTLISKPSQKRNKKASSLSFLRNLTSMVPSPLKSQEQILTLKQRSNSSNPTAKSKIMTIRTSKILSGSGRSSGIHSNRKNTKSSFMNFIKTILMQRIKNQTSTVLNKTGIRFRRTKKEGTSELRSLGGMSLAKALTNTKRIEAILKKTLTANTCSTNTCLGFSSKCTKSKISTSLDLM